MTGWLVLGGFLLAGLAALSMVLTLVVMAVKAVFWLVFLPFRLVAWSIGAVLMLVGTAVAIAFGLLLLLAPLLPLVILAAMVYGLIKLLKRPATA